MLINEKWDYDPSVSYAAVCVELINAIGMVSRVNFIVKLGVNNIIDGL